jgi:hypothetical protein
VGFFDPDETTSPEEGLYVVYIFAEDLGTVSLMLLQGITELDRELGHREARTRLAAEAEAIRAALLPGALDGLETSVQLASSGFRQLAYSAACVAAKAYDLPALPSEHELRDDLLRMLRLYQEAVDVKQQLAVTSALTATAAVAAQRESARTDPLSYFHPRDDSEYVARVVACEFAKSRRHETLLREYGEWIQTRHFEASTAEHPKDLVLRRDGAEWLMEGKVLYRGTRRTPSVRQSDSCSSTDTSFADPSLCRDPSLCLQSRSATLTSGFSSISISLRCGRRTVSGRARPPHGPTGSLISAYRDEWTCSESNR